LWHQRLDDRRVEFAFAQHGQPGDAGVHGH
jgi:hypothetical protein